MMEAKSIKAPKTLKGIVTFIVYSVTVIAAAGVTTLLSLLALPNIPGLPYCGRAYVAIALFFVIAFVAAIDAVCRAYDILNPNKSEEKARRGESPSRSISITMLVLLFILLLLTLVLFVSPGLFSYGYYYYSSTTSNTVVADDATCQSIEEAIEKDPTNCAYLKEAGVVYYRIGDYDKALGFLRESLEHCDKGDNKRLAELQFLMGKTYLHGLPDDSKDLLSNCDFEKNDLYSAQGMFLNSIQKEDSAECRFYYAITLYYQYLQDTSDDKAYEEALQNFDYAIEKGGVSQPQYYYWRGCLKYWRNPRSALGDLQKAESMVKYKASYQFALGLSYRACEERWKASQCFSLASNLDSDNATYREYCENSSDYYGEGSWKDSGGGRIGYQTTEVEAGKLGDQIVFNSIVDGSFGDERNFVRVKAAGETGDSGNPDVVDVHDGETYTIQLFVHNDSPKIAAEDVKALFCLPTSVSKSHIVTGCLTCPTAEPDSCWDSVVFNSDEYFYLEYVDGSAEYQGQSGVLELPNEIIIRETPIGLDGTIPGGDDHIGVVTINVRVHACVGAELQMKVRLKGDKEWAEVVDAQVGDEVEYQISYTNLLAETVDNVMIRDILPTNVRYQEGSTCLYNSSYPDGTLILDDTVATSGINIGSYQSRENAHVRFTGIVTDNTLAGGANQLVNWASATVRPHDGKAYVYKDDASVMCCL